jgi:hypothetical protein
VEYTAGSGVGEVVADVAGRSFALTPDPSPQMGEGSKDPYFV